MRTRNPLILLPEHTRWAETMCSTSHRRAGAGAELPRTLLRLATDSGVAAYRMVADRYHLYGREVLPVAYRAVVGGDRDAARAERMLLDHVEPYLHYAPESRLTKYSAESQARTSRRHVRSWPWPTCSTRCRSRPRPVR